MALSRTFSLRPGLGFKFDDQILSSDVVNVRQVAG